MKLSMLLPALVLSGAVLCQSAQGAQTPERILNIYKSTAREDGGQPLANISFGLYHTQTGALAANLITDADGFATYNFTQAGQPDGTYLLVEHHNPATRSAREPAYLSVPGRDGAGNPLYTQSLRSYNVAERGPEIRADVAELDRNSGSYPVGQLHTWILRCDIPPGLAEAKSYVITDQLDSRLRYEPGSTRVVLTDDTGAELPLDAQSHYYLKEGSSLLRISLTRSGMAYAAENLTGKKELRIFFQAAIHTNATMGATIPNDAMLEYTNSLGVSYKAESDIPEVHTGGINIVKTDGAGNPQPEVRFRLARQVEVSPVTLGLDGGHIPIRYETFYPTKDLSGQPADAVTTDAQGRAALYGLAYGTYYLIEEGAKPCQVQINETSHLTASEGWVDTSGNLVDKCLYIGESAPALPVLDGIGATLLMLAGLLTGGSAWLFLTERRKSWGP